MTFKVTCSYCERFLFNAVTTTIAEGVICSNSKCKAKLNIKIVFDGATDEQLHYKFTTPGAPPKRSAET